MSDEDEPECRVCRAPSDGPDDPLVRACKCRGSIGWVHQDCLQSWLTHRTTHGGPKHKCELCQYVFQFEPMYAPDTPEQLSLGMVLYGVGRKLTLSWLPATLRVVTCLAIWFVVMPVLTAHLYLSWMHKPSFVAHRLTWECLRLDWVGGMVVAALVIISFLSLMNFADFVRVEVQAPAMERRRLLRDLQQARNGVQDALPPLERQIDNELWVQAQQAILGDGVPHVHVPGLERNRMPEAAAAPANETARDAFDYIRLGDDDENGDDEDEDDESWVDHEDVAEDEYSDDDDRYVYSEDEDDDDEEDNAIAPPARRGRRAGRDHFDMNDEHMQRFVNDLRHHRPEIEVRNVVDDGRRGVEINFGARGGPPPPPPPPPPEAGFEDGADMDMNVALDEILGVRGPLNVVVRNLLWLLAFNAIYLGFFVFTPRIVGLAVSTIVFNTTSVFGSKIAPMNLTEWSFTQGLPHNETYTTDAFWHSVVANISSPMDILRAVETQSSMVKATFRLSDIFSVLLGYLACAATVLFFNFLWLAAARFEWMRTGRGRNQAQGDGERANAINDPNLNDVRDALEEFNRMLDGAERHLEGDGHVDLDGRRGMALVFALGVVLKAMTAVVKVGVLLLLKMLFMPVVLGFCLDASTLALLGGSLEDRIRFAGIDLFSFTLVHWVSGITFMLLVTVSVLQLREVVHPELLAQVVRPQEPQPDLLGNLLHERVLTHIKRMVMSLVVYACLLFMHIYLPIRVAMWVGFKPSLKFSFVFAPHLQVPLELLFFHLCMLGLLEKNKNIIGELQHHWLKFTCGLLGMTDSTLPQSISKFRLCGKRYVYVDESELDPFWQELAKSKDKQQRDFLEANAFNFTPPLNYQVSEGRTKVDGSRVLQTEFDFIRLPLRVPGRTLRCRSLLLPTRVGRFCLVRGQDAGGQHIELWEEVAGDAIPRPPEGWDDLGQGGAYEQSRWSWGKERKSVIENGVAHRDRYFKSQRNVFFACLKICILVIATWAMTSCLLALLVISPLAIGRSLLGLGRIPVDWIHDPFAYGLGSLFFFPMFHRMFQGLVRTLVLVDFRSGAASFECHRFARP